MVIACILLSIISLLLIGLCAYFYRCASNSGIEAAAAKTATDTLEAQLNSEIKILQSKLEVSANNTQERLETEKNNFEQRINDTCEAYERQISELKKEHAERLAEQRDFLSQRFQAMAAEVLMANSKQLDQQSRTSVETVLAPMKTQLEEFTKNFRECYNTESLDRLSMREEIKQLHELNMQVSAEAARLTHALKGNTGIQGKWGEMVLLNILEHSGLEKGTWFVTQSRSVTDEGEILKPDAIIHCPDQRDIIIDSKASLKAYFEYLESTDENERDMLMKQHVRSVEKHISDLSKKDYQNKVGMKTTDFVFMFMPHEGAFLAAMHAKPELWQNAYDSRVVLASPTHLVTIVQLVEQMWKSEKQSINSEKIAEQGAKLIDSINAFLTEMASVGKNLDNAQNAYQQAVKKLQTGNNNVVRVATRLSELGVKAKKSIPAAFNTEQD